MTVELEGEVVSPQVVDWFENDQRLKSSLSILFFCR